MHRQLGNVGRHVDAALVKAINVFLASPTEYKIRPGEQTCSLDHLLLRRKDSGRHSLARVT